MHSLMEQIANGIEAATKGISADELRFVPQPGKWSVGEILEHLTLAYTSTTLGLNRALERGGGEAVPISFKQKILRTAVLGLGYFPEGRKAPAHVVPQGKDMEYALDSALKSIPALDLVIAACEQRFGNGIRLLKHPVFGALSAKEWRRFHQVHTLHHLKQITRLRKLAGEKK